MPSEILVRKISEARLRVVLKSEARLEESTIGILAKETENNKRIFRVRSRC